MADSNSPAHLSVSPPNKISKDVPGPDNSIPLSPQWLLSKTGESNAGMSHVGNYSSPYAGSKNHADSGRFQGSGENVYDPHKKDIYRPSFFETEFARRDRWRDEERDTNVAIRRDRWKDGEEERETNVSIFPDRWREGDDKKDTNVSIRRDRWKEGDEELGDLRKMERWANNSSAKNFGEGRRVPSERWNDPTKEATSDQRRENKWSTQWGPDGKDKAFDLGKYGDASHERGSSNPNHGRDEKEGDHVRPWRTNTMNRGRTDHEHQQSHITSKDGNGHGRGDNSLITYSRSRGRLNLDISSDAKIPTVGKSDNGPEDHSPYKYNRPTLLDLFSVTNLRSPNLLGTFTQVPSLTQEEPGEPFALSALTSEELAIFRGIDEGDITTGAPPHKWDGPPPLKSKDISVRQGSPDFEAMRDGPLGVVDEVPRNREPVTQGNAAAWKASKISWSDAQKERSGLARSSYPQNEPKWQTGEDNTVRRQQLVSGDRQLETRKPLQPSPEDLVLYYKDPQGLVQGPFSGVDIIGWLEAGYFGIDLLVRLANAPPDSPYMALGDVMPHLCAEARPPPGFRASKPNEIPYIPTTRPLQTGQSGIEMIINDHNHTHGSMNSEETRFLESLMRGNVGSSSLGAQGYAGHSSSAFPPLGMESGDSLNLLAKRLAIEQQRSLPNSYPNCPVKDAPSVIPHFEIPHDSSFSQNMNLPPNAFGMLQQRMQPQNQPSVAHLLGQSVDNPSTVATPEDLLSSTVAQDPQILNLLQQQHMLLMQPQTPVNLQQLSMLDKVLLLKQQQKQDEQLRVQQQLLSSTLAQDPQILNLLQQQHILLMQPQTPLTLQQLSMLDNILVLKQQQKQEEQMRVQQQKQDVQLRVQQQQLIYSRVLAEHHQRLSEPAYAQLHPSVSVGANMAVIAGSTHVDHLHQMIPQQILQAGPQVLASTSGEDRSTSFDVSSHMRLPHQAAQHLSEPAYAQLHPSVSPVSVGANVAVTAGSTHVDHLQQMIPQQILQAGPQVLASASGEDRSTLFDVSSHMCLPHQAFADSVSKPVTLQNFQIDSAFITETSEMVTGNETLATSNVTTIINGVDKTIEAHETRKTSEKKSRKQKSSKAQTPSELVKGVAKSSLQQQQQILAGVIPDTRSDVPVISGLMDNKEAVEAEKVEDSSEVREVKSLKHVEKKNTFDNSAHREWKPTVNVKPKSIVEIQQEEERNVKTEIAVSSISSAVSSLGLSGPWAGIISNPEQNVSKDVNYSEINVSKTENSVAKKSQLHDLLAAEVLAVPIEKQTSVGTGSDLHFVPTSSLQADTVDDFIEAKNTRRSRKKAGKAKAAGSKSSTPAPCADAIMSSSPVEKVKSAKKLQQEDRLPAPPAGLSLGDFVSWKGGEATVPSPAPAWSSGNLPKPASLRDILVEEQRRGVPTQKQQLTTSQKSQALPSKASAPVQFSSQAPAQPKVQGEDDLFWGSLEQSKQEDKRSDFLLGNSGNKAISGVPSTGQNSADRKGSEIRPSPASSQSPLKGKFGGDNKRSEAMEFRSWCESETFKLTGSKDTSFLEFFLKQSRSEAEILMAQNLGGLDPNHIFINKFLDYMDMLPADVLALAFQGQNDQKATAYSARDMNSDNTAMDDYSDFTPSGLDGSARGGKKRGKKGKKVSLSALGFNVVSNRIMMGEIQTLDD